MSQSQIRNPRRKPLYPRGWGSGNVAYVGTFRAFSMAVLGRSSLEIGDKIIMPPEALQSINRLRLPFPLLFEVKKFGRSSTSELPQSQVLTQYKRRIENIYRSTNPTKIKKIDRWIAKYADNPHDLYLRICKTYGILPKAKIAALSGERQKRRKNGAKSKQKSLGRQFCSVYEFSSPQPDSIYLPHWMMQNMAIEEGGRIEVQSQFNVPKGTFCRLQPLKSEFMDKVGTIGYKSTLEHSLRHYSVLSLNQRIVVEFNHFPYECIVRELRPSDAVSILGSTDLEVEFEEPIENGLAGGGYAAENGTTTSSTTTKHHDDDDNDGDGDGDGSAAVCSGRDEDSSSLGMSDLEQSVEAMAISGVVDGALLKKLGVPLDYNEQTNLATMIRENRRMLQENHSRLQHRGDADNLVAECDGDGDGDGDDGMDTAHGDGDDDADGEQKRAGDEAPTIGPDDVECENCGKYVHSMSIQMHSMHCVRTMTACSECGQCIKIEDKQRHFEDAHQSVTCLCHAVFIGKASHRRHLATECSLRLMECSFCGRDNVTANTFEEHVAFCKEQEVECGECGTRYLLKERESHCCGVLCPLCGQRVADPKDKLLHLITECAQRRAICNYCGVLRSCHDMDQHRNFCGSRSEKCDKCNEFVALMNMDQHLLSNCQWFNNMQLSSSSKNGKKKKKRKKSSTQNAEYAQNPYVDQQLLDSDAFEMGSDCDAAGGGKSEAVRPAKGSLFGLLAQNPAPNLISSGVSMERQLCPHCANDDRFMSREEFGVHIAVSHPSLVDDTLTQTVMASFETPELLSGASSKRKLPPDAMDTAERDTKQSKSEQWSCKKCTFQNFQARKCKMCQTPKS